MDDPSSSWWAGWSGPIEAASITLSAIFGGIAAAIGVVWRGGHNTAAKAAREQHYADELAAMAAGIAKIEALEHRVAALEGQQNTIASRITEMSTALIEMRREMAAGFKDLGERQYRLMERWIKPSEP